VRDIDKYLIEFVEKKPQNVKSIDNAVAEFSSVNNLSISEMYDTMAHYYASIGHSELSCHCIEKRNDIEKFYNNWGGDPEI